MTKPPSRFRAPSSARDAAEAAFRAATTKTAGEAPLAPKPAAAPVPVVPPAAREMVSLRIDRDVLEHFQEAGPGWQDRINAALRKAAGK